MAGYDMFNEMMASIREDTVKMMFRVKVEKPEEREQVAKVTGTNKDDSGVKAPYFAEMHRRFSQMIRVHAVLARNISSAAEDLLSK